PPRRRRRARSRPPRPRRKRRRRPKPQRRTRPRRRQPRRRQHPSPRLKPRKRRATKPPTRRRAKVDSGGRRAGAPVPHYPALAKNAAVRVTAGGVRAFQPSRRLAEPSGAVRSASGAATRLRRGVLVLEQLGDVEDARERA